MIDNNEEKPNLNEEDTVFMPLKEHKCAICGKPICRLDWTSYTYKLKSNNSFGYRVYCSYTCFRKAQAAMPAKKKNTIQR